MRLTDEKYWDDSYSQNALQDFFDHDVAIFLQRNLMDGHGKTSLEVGSFPGSFIPTISRKGFLVHGVDFNARNSTDLPTWLKSKGCHVGEFWVADFFDFIKDENKRFDLVCSFGFIEHFGNYLEIIKAHMELLKPGGQLIITTPNFRGWMQFIPHRLFDKNNLNNHYLPSMCPIKWKHMLEENNYDISFAGFFGGYGFYVDHNDQRNIFTKILLRIVENTIRPFKKLFKLVGLESTYFSAYCGIVAVKRYL